MANAGPAVCQSNLTVDPKNTRFVTNLDQQRDLEESVPRNGWQHIRLLISQ
jgi:hypothetical protein